MRRQGITYRAGAVLVALALAFSGCKSGNNTGDPEVNKQQYELQEIGNLYKTYLQEKNHPPTRAADLRQYEVGFPVGFQALQSGECIAVWGIDLSKVPNPSATVLAYRKDVPTEGGWVLLADQTVRKMTPDEFKAAIPKGKV